MNSRQLFFPTYLILVLTAGCATGQKTYGLKQSNPTLYTFPASSDKVHQVISSEFGKMPGYRYMKLNAISDGDIKQFSAHRNDTSRLTKGDYKLSYSGSIGKSEIYYGKSNEPLPYYAEFIIHLIAVDTNRTTVQIITIDPKVAVGRKLFPSLPHFVRMVKTKPVPPTTIEEYEILLQIGRALGNSGLMPRIQRPNF